MISSSSQALQLYRHLLRVSRRWPTIEGREERGLTSIITERIKSGFRSNAKETDQRKIISLLDFGRKEADALEMLVTNKLMKQVL